MFSMYFGYIGRYCVSPFQFEARVISGSRVYVQVKKANTAPHWRRERKLETLAQLHRHTYTCLSSGRAGSTLSPRRGGVSPTIRRVAAFPPTEVDVGLVLVSLVCSVWALERPLSAPSN